MVIFKMPPRENPSSGLRSLMEQFADRCDLLASRGLDAETWYAEFLELLEAGYRDTYEYGYFVSSGRTPAVAVMDEVGQMVRDLESYYARGFANELADLTEEQIARRMKTYAGRMRGVANGGWVDGVAEDEEIWWVMSAAEHCDDCPVHEANSPYTKNTIPAVPGDNSTPCLFNCKCYLRTRTRRAFEPVNVWDSEDGQTDQSI
jgi:hypothetical protein